MGTFDGEAVTSNGGATLWWAEQAAIVMIQNADPRL
jgi:hypothetical protein